MTLYSRNSNEHEVEKRVEGFVFIFLVMLVAIEVLLFVLATAAAHVYLKSLPLLSSAVIFLGLGYIIFILFICLALFKIPKLVIKAVKVFLIARLIYLVPIFIENFIKALHNPEYVQAGQSQRPLFDTALYAFLVPMIYVLSFSILWYIYFSKSKRVKETYAN